MKFQRKQVFALLSIVIILLVVFHYFFRDDSLSRDYIIEKNGAVTVDDVKALSENVDFSDAKRKNFFSGDVVNRYTFRYFKFLQKKFQDASSLDEHLNVVREYLFTTMDPGEAEKLFALYKKFVDYERKLAEKLKSWGRPSSSRDLLKTLHSIYDYQKETFGEEIALKLFGASIKAREYPIRRSSIVNDKSLYGAEKEAQIKQLDEDMWGRGKSSPIGASRPYERYRDRLQIYSRDLSELPPAEKAEKIREFRKEFFSPEVQARLEDVDRRMAETKASEEAYREREQAIINDPNVTTEEKETKLRELQKEIFGSGADAFRRRENIRRALKER